MGDRSGRARLVFATTPAATATGDLGAPLCVAWQVMRECNLAGWHGVEERGPGQALPYKLVPASRNIVASSLVAVSPFMLGILARA